jgi:type III secretion system YscD/HrpQ family protein
MASKLIADEGNFKDLILSFDKGDQWIIGRDPELSSIVIEDPSVSREHLKCIKNAEGMVIENLSTTNPVLVNDSELKAQQILHDGDILKIGNGVFRYDEDPSDRAAILTDTQKIDKKDEEEGQMEPREDTIFDENAPAGKDALAEINFEVVETGRWLLKVISGPNNGAEYSMQTSNNYVIGTDPNTCDVVFHDTSVSRQHARIGISAEDIMTIEDLQSRNGTLLDGEPLKTKKQLMPNTLAAMGTTSFIVYDREGEMQTIISPLLPSIVKVLQKEEPKKENENQLKEEREQEKKIKDQLDKDAALKAKEKANHHMGALIAIAIIVGLFLVVGAGTVSLFQSQPVVVEQQTDSDALLADAMKPFVPNIRYSINKSTGRILLVGHVLTVTDKNQLLYNLQGLKSIKNIDDSGVIIDEYVWQEMNQLLANNSNWKGITIQATSPGHFVLSGYLQTRKQAEQLSQYVSENFRYLDLLEKNIVVDEDVIATVSNQLQSIGIKNLAVQISNGELTITGSLPSNKTASFEKAVAQFRSIAGVRLVKDFVTELPPEQTLINISDKYTVTGYSNLGKNISVVINGRILSQGDILDGMIITVIQPNVIMLEKDNVKYRIDYSK